MQNVSASPQFSPAGETTEDRIAWVIDSGRRRDRHAGRRRPADPPAPRDDRRRLRKLPDHGQRVGLARCDRRSVELFAEYVMPVFQDDSTSRLRESEQWCRERRSDLFDRQATRSTRPPRATRRAQEIGALRSRADAPRSAATRGPSEAPGGDARPAPIHPQQSQEADSCDLRMVRAAYSWPRH